MRSILCRYLFNFLSDNKLIDEFICDIKRQDEDPDFSFFQKEGFYFVHLKKGKLTELIVKLLLGEKIFFFKIFLKIKETNQD